MAALTLTATNSAGTTLGSASVALADGDLTRLGNALNFSRYAGLNLTVAQAIRQAYLDWIGDLKALTLAAEQQQTASVPIPTTVS